MNLQKLNLVELSVQEQQEVEGGIFWFGLIAVAICLAYAISQL